MLFGDRFLYYLLSAYDPDFLELFKITADFEEDIVALGAIRNLHGVLDRGHGQAGGFVAL